MRKLLWMILCLGAYLWLVTSGHDEFVLRQGQAVYEAFISWFDDAEMDFQLKKEKVKKKGRRWD
jgi:hypothetical protein